MADRKRRRSQGPARTDRRAGGGNGRSKGGAGWRSFLLGVALFVSFFWGILHLNVFLTVVLIALDVDNYRPARFTVDEVVYSKPRKRPTEYIGIGRIDGVTPESVNLFAFAPEMRTVQELEQHFRQKPVVLDVMYNPTRTAVRINGDSIRVQAAEPNFAIKYRNSAWYGFVNVALSAVIVVFCTYWLRRLNPKRPKPPKPPAPETARR